MADKREMVADFSARLAQLLERSGRSRSQFATDIGIDRSALSQFLSTDNVRLPRAETIIRIARAHGVSADWLLGLTADSGIGGTISSALSLEEIGPDGDRPLLARWHREAAGAKIRYVPARIPDLLRTDRMIAFDMPRVSAGAQAERDVAQAALDRIEQPDSDMEICMPRQTLELLAAGLGVFEEMPRSARVEQLERMGTLLAARYPRIRLYLFNSRDTFSSPFTVFGQVRAAIYLGNSYFVFNTRDTIQSLVARFDVLVRRAEVHAHEAADHCHRLAMDAR